MISKITFSVVKKNLPVLKCVGMMDKYKIIHCFSDNNKKNPFDKFKRNNSVKNTQQPQKNQENNENKAQKHHQKTDQNQSHRTHFQSHNQHRGRSVNPAGFSKFKRPTNYEEKMNLKKVEEQKPSEKHQEKQKQEHIFHTEEHKTTQKIQNQTKNQQPEVKTTQKLDLRGFSKFKKVQVKQSTHKTLQSQQKSSNIKSEQNQKKQEATLNTKTDEQIQRENAYKSTGKKIEQDKEEWQNFLQDQIKKQKQKKINTKKQQSKPYEWKNFNFTGKRQEQKNQQQGQKEKQQKSGPFQAPKTPLQAMKMLFFGGIGIYLGSLLLSELLSFDSSLTVSTEQMMSYLKEGRIIQTWFLTQVQSLSEESSRTKKYLCSSLENGNVCKCQSNNDFQTQWNRRIDQHNIDMQTFGGNPVLKRPPIIKKDSHIFNTVRSILSFALLFMFIRSIMGGVSRGKGQMGGKGGGGLSGMFQNTKSHRFRQPINVKFENVVGMNKAKEEIVEFIDFLKQPEKYNKLGAKIPRGALLTGPPGTGKTLLAKACAGESGVPFFTISGSEFMQMYVGVGAQRVRNLFNEAKEASPAIIFIDEIDAVGKKRASGVGGGGNDERDNTLNQLLVEMDGFDQTTNVIVFAATNQKQVLDPALTRPGRFDRLIEVDLPDIEGRKEIFMVHLKPITLDEKYQMEDYAKRLATLTPGFSGADIKNLCNEAAIIAARNDKKFVSMIDFELASERIIGGVEKKSTLITPQTKRTVAYHECGHGVVSWFMQHASPLLKLTIIPRSKGALGYAQYLPNENQVYTRKQLQDQICVILGGRIAEQIFFNKISTGASDDLQKAHKVAKAIVAEYGMGNKLGWLSYSQTEYAKQYSHLIEQKIDEQILEIIYQCSVKTRQIITGKKDQIQNLAQLLLKEQTIDQRMIQSVLGERPFKSSKQYEEYIREKQKLQEEDKKLIDEAKPEGGSAAFMGLPLDKIGKKSTKFDIIQNS